MRLWTIHPQYLDAKGLVAGWREALLAQKVLLGETKGYRHHPQLIRFQENRKPMDAIGQFLSALSNEAVTRGYRFDATKILRLKGRVQLIETEGQLLYEWTHLKEKLKVRAPDVYRKIRSIPAPEPHPLFKIIPGPVREWERRE